jgi:hypothetical protein
LWILDARQWQPLELAHFWGINKHTNFVNCYCGLLFLTALTIFQRNTFGSTQSYSFLVFWQTLKKTANKNGKNLFSLSLLLVSSSFKNLSRNRKSKLYRVRHEKQLSLKSNAAIDSQTDCQLTKTNRSEESTALPSVAANVVRQRRRRRNFQRRRAVRPLTTALILFRFAGTK